MMNQLARFAKPQSLLQTTRLIAASNPRTIHCTSIQNGVISSKDEVAPVYKKMQEKYKRFQVDDGVPVHLKMGARDVILYYFTLGVIGVGLMGCAEFLYSQSFPKK